MSEQGHEFVSQIEDPDTDETEDVEGHVQPPRGDDTDHVHSLLRQ